MLQSASQTRWGSARKSRKRTVRRGRTRSSSRTKRRIGPGATGGIIEAGYDDLAVAGPVHREDVLRAAEVIRGRIRRTPTLTADALGPGVRLKAELFQHTGSFKPRGVLTKLASLTPAEKARGVIGISAGNHAQALAWGAAQEGIDCLVVTISSSSPTKVAATRSYGAAVDTESDDWVEAF